MAKGIALGVLLPVFCLPAFAKPQKNVLAFYPNWGSPPQIRYDKITHLMYAFLFPSSGGGISGSVPGDLVSNAHNQGVKVIASIGGANHSGEFPPLAASASARQTFANNCKNIVNSGVDGVDIDWEYPSNATDSANFTLLLREIRNAIGPNKILSLDIAPDNEKGRWISRSALDIADFYNVMSYDFTGSFAPNLPGQHASFQKAVIGINYWWRNRGVKKEKVILGLPFYGKDFNAGGANVFYRDIVAFNPGLSADADSVGRTWFNGPTTIKEKATFVAENSYGGVMIWELSLDAAPGPKSLLDAAEAGLAAPPTNLVSFQEKNGRFTARNSSSPTLTWMGMTGAQVLTPESLRGLRVRDITGRRIGISNGHPLSAPAAGVYSSEVIHAN